MPLYEYYCDNEKCTEVVEELLPTYKRDTLVGHVCTQCDTGKLLRKVSMSHAQDLDFTAKSKTDRELRNPTGEFREVMQRMKDSPTVDRASRKNLESKYNI